MEEDTLKRFTPVNLKSFTERFNKFLKALDSMKIIHNQTDVSMEELAMLPPPVNMSLPAFTGEDTGPSSIEELGEVVIKTSASTEAPTQSAAPSIDLMAALFGATSEVVLDLKDASKPFAIALYKDGVWEKRTNTIGEFVFHREKASVPYISKSCEPSFNFKLPKIPGGILNATSKLFLEIMKKMGNSESMVQIYWNTETKTYFIYVPEQYVSGASIKFLHNQEYQNNDKYIWVLDIHSHNTMGAFFSGGDDRDEKSTRIFGVLGKLTPSGYECVWRAGCNGKYFPLRVDDIFDREESTVVEIPDADLEKIKPYSQMPDSLKSCIVSVGYSGGDNVYQSGYRPRMPDPNKNYQMPWRGDAKPWTKWMSERSKRRLETRYPRLDDDDRDDARNSVMYSTPHNSLAMQSTVEFDLSADNVSWDCYKALKSISQDLASRIEQGPSNLFRSSKDMEYKYSSQLLLELLESVLSQLNDELEFDTGSDTFEEDLTDISIQFATMLANFTDYKKYLNVMAREIGNR